mgnify:CR=1 FL=1
MYLTQSEKLKLASRGKRLNPLKIKYESEKLLGEKFRKILAEELKVTTVLITHAFKGRAPYTLWRISKLLKQKTINK